MGRWIWTIIVLIACTVLTHVIPFSGFFRNLDTMIHESGHAVTTLLLSGRVMEIELYVDHSGVTRSAVSQSWAIIPIALSGYMTASLFAWLLFALYARGRHKAGLILMTIVAALALLLFVRNGYGVSWLIGFIAISAGMLMFGGQTVGKWYFLLLAFLTLEESVFGPFSLILYAVSGSNAGDATNLSHSTMFPAIVWAAWFTLFALWCAKRALTTFASRSRSSAAAGTSGRSYS